MNNAVQINCTRQEFCLSPWSIVYSKKIVVALTMDYGPSTNDFKMRKALMHNLRHNFPDNLS